MGCILIHLEESEQNEPLEGGYYVTENGILTPVREKEK